jgi:hypothetical protein
MNYIMQQRQEIEQLMQDLLLRVPHAANLLEIRGIGVGGLPPGVDVESQWPKYKQTGGLFVIPKNHTDSRFTHYPESGL